MDLTGLRDFVKRAPEAPGCYIFKDAQGRFLYVGKAKSIRQRLTSYVDGFRKLDKVRRMVQGAAQVEFILAGREADALLLENNLIKKHKPRYNVNLKDDKTYPMLEIDYQQAYAYIGFSRKMKPGNVYFGPFSSAKKLRRNIMRLRQIFKLRHCKGELKVKQTNVPCLYHQMGRCDAPCNGSVSLKQYQKKVRQLVTFLKGKDAAVLQELENEMQEASENLEFEIAAKIRDTIRSLKAMLEKQKVVLAAKRDLDVLGIYQEGEYLVISTLFIRRGVLIDKLDQSFFLGDALDQGLDGFVLNRYQEGAFIPERLVITGQDIDRKGLVDHIKALRRGFDIIQFPRGEVRELADMAQKNAKLYFATRVMYHKQYLERVMEQLQQALCLRRLPRVIDSFDISHLSGQLTVGVCIRFAHGQPSKKHYRKYNLKHAANDLESIRESVFRRYRKLTPAEQPDLVLIDGGVLQLGKAMESLRELKLDMDIVAISKQNRQGQEYEELHVPGGRSVALDTHKAHLLFLARVRDETHRFAIASHKQRRRGRFTRSVLDDIPGIGPKRKARLLAHFSSLQEMAEATKEDLMAAAGIGRELAFTIKTALQAAQVSSLTISSK